MPKFLVKVPCDGVDYYLEWSTIVDAPTTYGMTRGELEEYTREELGKEGLRQLPARLQRLDSTGTSSYDPTDTFDNVVELNRCGEWVVPPRERHLTREEIIDEYVRKPRKKKPGG